MEISCDEINSKPSIKKYLDNKPIFVCSLREGEAIDKLIAADAKIYGVGALISSPQMKSSLPWKSKDFIQGCVSSMAFRSKNVCFTKVQKEDREALQKKVARMTGYICSTMMQDVDILVVGEASPKNTLSPAILDKMTLTITNRKIRRHALIFKSGGGKV